MELTLDKWTNKDILEFVDYVVSLKNTPQKCLWESKLAKTSLPCLMIPQKTIDNIVEKIYKGNFYSYLDFMPWANHSCVMINGKLISKIKDFYLLKKYLDSYSAKVDNWAGCDVLNINSNYYYDKLANLILDYLSSPLTFRRRIAVVILFSYINSDIDFIFSCVDKLSNEQEYYVNMAVSWLLCECFIQNRDATIKYLSINRLNDFVINKFISKCNDSFRVNQEDKIFLKKLHR